MWNNFICYSCHKVINNLTYQIARMCSLVWALLQILYEPNFDIGGFRNSQSDVILAHAHIGGLQCIGQLHLICVKCGLIF